MASIDPARLIENARRIERELASMAQDRDVLLVIVTKTRPDEAVETLFRAGCRHFGENRVDAFARRSAGLPGASWHFIGRLHKKNAAKVVGKAALIHSVASPALLEKIERSAAAADVIQPVLLQVNVIGEEQKQGFTPLQLREYAAATDFDKFPHVRIRGLMTMAPFTPDERIQRACFSGLRALRDELDDALGLEWRQLSMGMTNDYPAAVREGATIVRIGSAVFEGVEHGP